MTVFERKINCPSKCGNEYDKQFLLHNQNGKKLALCLACLIASLQWHQIQNMNFLKRLPQDVQCLIWTKLN